MQILKPQLKRISSISQSTSSGVIGENEPWAPPEYIDYLKICNCDIVKVWLKYEYL